MTVSYHHNVMPPKKGKSQKEKQTKKLRTSRYFIVRYYESNGDNAPNFKKDLQSSLRNKANFTACFNISNLSLCFICMKKEMTANDLYQLLPSSLQNECALVEHYLLFKPITSNMYTFNRIYVHDNDQLIGYNEFCQLVDSFGKFNISQIFSQNGHRLYSVSEKERANILYLYEFLSHIEMFKYTVSSSIFDFPIVHIHNIPSSFDENTFFTTIPFLQTYPYLFEIYQQNQTSNDCIIFLKKEEDLKDIIEKVNFGKFQDYLYVSHFIDEATYQKIHTYHVRVPINEPASKEYFNISKYGDIYIMRLDSNGQNWTVIFRDRTSYLNYIRNSQPLKQSMSTEQTKTSKSLEFDRKRYNEFKQISKLGEGATADVFEVEDSRTGVHYAQKSLKLKYMKPENYVFFKREYKSLIKVNHPCIVNIIGFYDEPNGDIPPTIFIELMKCSLLEAVNKRFLTYIDKCMAVLEICLGMKFIHDSGLMHRDLKLDNVMFFEDDTGKHVKIADFGLSRHHDSATSKTRGVGTLRYQSPELLNDDKHYDKSVDVWAFGVCVYAIFTQSYPEILMTTIASKGYRDFSIPSSVDPQISQMIRQCWEYEPSKRSTFEELANYLKTNNYFLSDRNEILTLQKRHSELE
ncbi:hypothetical protein TRFO_16847 [Tritrichomonas foetus]|uniref:Protein kinase domain-containing protein n=1 Tax=Tritrichomonas foetus TaxID=1144522 RepID=A0A1J4KTT0_9EUKA|nr:hypothetical protein TRFO_16847 [Tritrichomonas foetus]|eukprot:OHT13172.1 hypothetical protein TRFO_16847 [Tritrichomonas foetus]